MLFERSVSTFIFSLLALSSPSRALQPDAVDTANYTTARGDYYRICPLPKCTSCPTREAIRAPGIGFALETGYG